MGRPINKRYFGPLADADDPLNAPKNDTKFNITINAKVAANAVSEAGYILAQRSTRKFLVNDTKDGTKRTLGGTGTGNVGVCTLVDKPSNTLANNEMSINAVLFAQDSTTTTIRIAKIYNKTCRDFSNNRYTWETQDDSTATIFVITPL
jgi:hypothetical protein